MLGGGLHEVRRPRVEHTARGPHFPRRAHYSTLHLHPKTVRQVWSTGKANRYQPNTSLPAWRDHAGSAAHDVASDTAGRNHRQKRKHDRSYGIGGWGGDRHDHHHPHPRPREDSQLHHVLAIAARTAMTSFRSNRRNSRSYRLTLAPQALLNNELRNTEHSESTTRHGSRLPTLPTRPARSQAASPHSDSTRPDPATDNTPSPDPHRSSRA